MHVMHKRGQSIGISKWYFYFYCLTYLYFDRQGNFEFNQQYGREKRQIDN